MIVLRKFNLQIYFSSAAKILKYQSVSFVFSSVKSDRICQIITKPIPDKQIHILHHPNTKRMIKINAKAIPNKNNRVLLFLFFI